MAKILMVDDSLDLADSLALMFELMGHVTRAVYGGVEGVGMAAEFAPDIIFMDLDMPHLDGYGAARLVRGQQGVPRPLLIAISASTALDTHSLTQDAGFDHFLSKPPDIALLIRLVDGVTAARGADDAPEGVEALAC